MAAPDTDAPPHHRVLFLLVAVLGGLFAAAWIGGAVLALMKLDDPSSLPVGTMDNPPDELRLLVVVGFALGGFVGLIAVCAALGLVVGPARTQAHDPRGNPLDPTLLLGEQTTLRRPALYIAPEDARVVALPCAVALLVLSVGVTASWWVWRLPLFYYFAAAVITVLGTQCLVYVVGVLLAARRLHLRFTRVPAAVRAGERFEVEVELRPRGPLAIDAVRVVLAGLAEYALREGTSRVPHVDVLHREVRRIALDGAVSEKARRFRCALAAPAGAGHPTGTDREGRTIRWIVAALVDIPSWPDAARVAEVRVTAPSG